MAVGGLKSPSSQRPGLGGKEAAEGLSCQFVRKPEGMGEAGHRAVFLDRTRLERRAGQYPFVWRKRVETQALSERREGHEEMRATTGEGRSSDSKPAPDAAFIRLKEGHMGNGQRKPGYKANSEYITGLGLCLGCCGHFCRATQYFRRI